MHSRSCARDRRGGGAWGKAMPPPHRAAERKKQFGRFRAEEPRPFRKIMAKKIYPDHKTRTPKKKKDTCFPPPPTSLYRVPRGPSWPTIPCARFCRKPWPEPKSCSSSWRRRPRPRPNLLLTAVTVLRAAGRLDREWWIRRTVKREAGKVRKLDCLLAARADSVSTIRIAVLQRVDNNRGLQQEQERQPGPRRKRAAARWMTAVAQNETSARFLG